MPRHTHPTSRNKHSRAQVRHQRERWIERRWAKVKSGEHLNRCEQSVWYRGAFFVNRHGWRALSEEEQQLAEKLGQVGPVLYIHPSVARHLSPEEKQWVGSSYGDNLDKFFKIFPRRLTYEGSNYHDSWGFFRPLRVTKALDYRGKQRWKREAWEEADAFYGAYYDFEEYWELADAIENWREMRERSWWLDFRKEVRDDLALE